MAWSLDPTDAEALGREGMMSKFLKIAVLLWLIMMVAWVVVLVGNVRAAGWDIIGLWDIVPMAAGGILLLAGVIIDRRQSAKSDDDKPEMRTQDDDPEP